jgi:hypothetical protein
MAKWEGAGRRRPIRRAGWRVVGLNQALSAIGRLPECVDEDVRKASGRIAERTASEARQRAWTTGYKVTRLAAGAISTKRTRAGKYDRIPTVVLGSDKILPGRAGRPNNRRQTYNAIAAGAEFGGSRGSFAARGVTKAKVGGSVPMPKRGGGIYYSVYKGSTRQFPPYKPSASGRGGEGYFLYPTVRRLLPWAMTEWSEAARSGIRRA